VAFLIRRRDRQLAGLNPGLRLFYWKHDYAIVSETQYKYVASIRAKVLQTGLQLYKHKFDWTGVGNASATPLSDLIDTAVIYSDPTGPGEVCGITFKNSFREGQIIDFSYQIDFHDPNGKAKPFINHNTEVPLDFLALRVRFPIGWPGLKYRRQSFASSVTDTAQPEDVELSPNALGFKKAFWDMPRPRLGHKYQILWAKVGGDIPSTEIPPNASRSSSVG